MPVTLSAVRSVGHFGDICGVSFTTFHNIQIETIEMRKQNLNNRMKGRTDNGSKTVWIKDC